MVTTTSAGPVGRRRASCSSPLASSSGASASLGRRVPPRSCSGAPLRCWTSTALGLPPNERSSIPRLPAVAVAERFTEATTCAPIRREAVFEPAIAAPGTPSRNTRSAALRAPRRPVPLILRACDWVAMPAAFASTVPSLTPRDYYEKLRSDGLLTWGRTQNRRAFDASAEKLGEQLQPR